MRVVAVVTVAFAIGCNARLAGPPRIAPIQVNHASVVQGSASDSSQPPHSRPRYITWRVDERPPAEAIVADALQSRRDRP